MMFRILLNHGIENYSLRGCIGGTFETALLHSKYPEIRQWENAV